MIVLTTVSDSVILTKKVSPAGVEPYDHAKHFFAEALELEDLQGVFQALQILEKCPRSAVVRGEIIPGVSTDEPIRRLLRPKDGDPATLQDCARPWVMIDVDHNVVHDQKADPEGAARLVRKKLPKHFQGCDVIWQASASAGLDEEVKVHLWYWLSRPMTSTEVRQWVSKLGLAGQVDMSVFSPIQIHYTAAPIFEGMEDPMSSRLGFIEGGRRAVEISSEELSEIQRKLDAQVSHPVPRKATTEPAPEAAQRDAAQVLRDTWPTEGRGHNEAVGALVGWLLGAGWSTEVVESFAMLAVPPRKNPRGREIPDFLKSTEEALEAGRPTTGWTRLSEAVGRPAAVEARELLGLEPLGAGVSLASDLGTAAAFIEDHGEDLRYCYPRKRWLAWTGTHWTWDAAGEVERRAQKTAKRMLRRAAEALDEGKVKGLASIANRARQVAMVDTARAHLEGKIEDLDCNPWILACPNGSLDLRTAELRPHQREDFVTKVCPIAYDPLAECRQWLAFLEASLATPEGGPDHELARFVQRAVGYSLTGETREQALFLLVGPRGNNGKSVLLTKLQQILGELATTISFNTLLSDKHGRNKGPELLPLLGARLAIAIEPNAGQKLDESLIKNLTGEDIISVNPKYELTFSFQPKTKLWLACNEPPRTSSGGDSMVRRIKVIPFHRHFVRAEERAPEGPLEGVRDPLLGDALTGELPGILRWAVEGCLEWQRIGLSAPKSVQMACDEYRGEADPLAGWIEACVHKAPGSRVKVTEASQSLNTYAAQNGFIPPSGRRLPAMLRSHGFTVKKVGGHGSFIFDVVVALPAGSPGMGFSTLGGPKNGGHRKMGSEELQNAQ